jgi:predicted glycoside hydrolase/deacetylase ChbG (UPF0249 family)
MSYLIVNADDFGWTKGINTGIIQAHRDGIVSSTTVMMNMPYAFEAVRYSNEYPNLGFGVHLVLSDGKPLGSNYKTLTCNDGFFKPDFIKVPSFDPWEVQTEWSLQIEAFLSMGIKPTHFDSHMHIHRRKELKDVVFFLQKKYKLPVRHIFNYRTKGIKKCAGFNKDFYKQNVSFDTIVKAVQYLKERVALEIMCHPAHACEQLNNVSPYNILREKELQVLCDKRLKAILQQYKVQLVNYGTIPETIIPYYSLKDRVKNLLHW